MELHFIGDTKKRFVDLLTLLHKSGNSVLNLFVSSDDFHMQGIDKANVGFYDIHIKPEWFSTYSVDAIGVVSYAVSLTLLNSILSKSKRNDVIILSMQTVDADRMIIKLPSPDGMDLEYDMPTQDLTYELMDVPQNDDYDVEFKVSSHTLNERLEGIKVLSAATVFISCNDDEILFLNTCSESDTKGKATIPVDKLESYAAMENTEINMEFSMQYLMNMCSTAVSPFVEVCLHSEKPLKLKYSLDGDASDAVSSESYACFYLAPRISEE